VSSAVFYRDLHATYQSVVSAEGMYLCTDGGQRILDAVGGAGTVVLGHGVRAITDAIARHGTEVSFSYGATFTNPRQEQLAEALVAMNPRVARRVYFVSGGSEGNETAVKMARQYHLQCGRPGRHKVIARWQSFHGSTLATLSLSGPPAWREPFLPMLPPAPHIVPPYCYRCPFGHAYPGCGGRSAGAARESPGSVRVACPSPAGQQAYDLLNERWATCRRGISPRSRWGSSR
jgi:adenosylmethionine-8-amino-7-oxononanoate aminotransferase